MQQALDASQQFRQLIGDESVRVYLSPYSLTRLTYQLISQIFAANMDRILEDPHLREQDWGHLRVADQNPMTSRIRSQFTQKS